VFKKASLKTFSSFFAFNLIIRFSVYSSGVKLSGNILASIDREALNMCKTSFF
jgi:hypothetical protein